MKKFALGAFAIVLLGFTLPLHAQSGCTDSPENPTAILVLVGAAGAAVANLRSRLHR